MSALEYIIAAERQKTLLRSDKENHWQIDYLESAQIELQKYQNKEAENGGLMLDNQKLITANIEVAHLNADLQVSNQRMADVVSAAVRWRADCTLNDTCDCIDCTLIRAVDKYQEAINGTSKV
jgi:hypothetical protein